MSAVKARTILYYVPVRIKLTAAQMEQVVADNMETWDISEEAAVECNHEDTALAAVRLGLIDGLPEGSEFIED